LAQFSNPSKKKPLETVYVKLPLTMSMEDKPIPSYLLKDKWVNQVCRKPQPYKHFAFFYRRTCLRKLNEFMREACKEKQDFWVNQKIAQMHDEPIMFLINDLVNTLFPGLLKSMNKDSIDEFLEYFKLYIFASKTRKECNFLVLEERPDNSTFDLVRNPMYKYSKNSEMNFFRKLTYSFLFSAFYLSKSGQ